MQLRAHTRRPAVLAALAVAAMAVGCQRAAERRPASVGAEVLGALAVSAMREAYGTPALTVRAAEGGKHVAVADADLAPETRVDDTNLLVFVEGAGDTADGFRATSRLLAESPYAFPGGGGLVVVLLKWSQSANPVAEHMNRPAQEAGAAVLARMLEVHQRRHGNRGHVSLVAFSAGTRVVQIALTAAAGGKPEWHPEAFQGLDHVIFMGSSIGTEEVLPLAPIRGRFINFINPRDTHFGDRAAYAAPAGEMPDPLKVLGQATLQRRPRFGVSVAGFRAWPTLTAVEQFDAADVAAAQGASPAVRDAFKRVNVTVPPTLVAYSLFGDALVNDDFDDYLNLARNHYIMVGRGPGGRTDVPDFKQYRAASEEFVRDFVGAAAFQGRLYRLDLRAVTKGANPLWIPLPVPWAVFKGAPEQEPAPREAPVGPGVSGAAVPEKQ